MSHFHMCNFSSGLDSLTRRKQRDRREVLKVLHRAGRFSCFEASANDVIAVTMTELCASDLIETDNSCGYPWTKVKLTDKGLALIGEPAAVDIVTGGGR